MTEEQPFIENEIDDHKAYLSDWVSKISSLDIPGCKKGVTDRFVRDCETLKVDLDDAKSPTADDLCDFSDRRNSLEVQYHNISQDIS